MWLQVRLLRPDRPGLHSRSALALLLQLCGCHAPHIPDAPVDGVGCVAPVPVQKVDPKTDGAARDWVAIYDECR